MTKAKSKKRNWLLILQRNWLLILLSLSILAGCTKPGMTCGICNDIIGDHVAQ